MIAASLGSLMKGQADGVIILNENYEILWQDLSEIISFEFTEGTHISNFIPCEHVRFMDNESFSVTLNQRKFSVEVKVFSANHPYIILCFEDISDLLKNPKMRLYCLEKIIESLGEGIMMSNQKGEIVLYNLAQEKMEGLNRNEIIGQHLWSVYNYNPQNSEHKHTFKTGKPIFSRYRAHSTVNGVPKYVNYSTFPIQKDGETIAVYSISTNETRLKDMLYQTIEQKRKITSSEKSGAESKNGTTYTFENIKGNSLALKNLIKEAQNIAIHNTDVLIVGETGTGKELFAQSIHNHSPRANSPFIAINCAAIPENLLESTLFGTVKGAFTGATNQIGLFEHAKDGTLFLDEINSMPMTLQSKLMRVLQERLVRRVGSNDVTPVQCTVISASNEDPERLISEGKMRLDLFYRIARTSLFIPPLRERTEDIHFFIEYFLESYQDKFNKEVPNLSKSLQTTLLQYYWPGNTRELEHLIENIIIRVNETDRVIEVDHLPTYIRRKIFSQTKNKSSEMKELEKKPIKSIFANSKEHFILTTLEQTDWNISKAARKLGITRQSLQYHIKKYGIEKPS
ncbi:sigma 54-interacting transcriptional regulator [Bacillus sp. DTU_2020_1000418_1_SI_GHA_SEK_038]|uniref:sigma-54 interaction domain-containing protein n=1 Tax=Bacillus sp. DTU_2020_1000418_1_SI_GHA_SEK_038 TaxID=3077585 RepID=UPI0028EA351E|nr:sigma 54-interacting transcriptional regulator [Bacillus sp. DTU_2020_1000418_1_SI_GHA_SEK_038]WNS76356.1 sigma 54-interacting transcriptional regulator [Bacillus sp. DTU_2020_1000418_1_SI_GHA_SEK_038]